MTITVSNYAAPTLIAKRIAQEFYTQSPLIKTANTEYKKMFNTNAITTVGSVVNVPIDNRFTLQRSNTVVSEAIVDRTVPLTVQQPYRTSVNYTTTDEKLFIRDLDDQTAKPCAAVIAAGMEQDLIQQAELYGYNFLDFTSTYDNAATGLLDNKSKILQAATFFREYSVPSNMPWYLNMTPGDYASLANGTAASSQFFPKTNDAILRDDIKAIGHVSSFDCYWSEVIYSHVAGTAAGDTNVQVAATVSSGSSVQLKGLTPGATIVAGDRLTFTDSQKVNPVTRQDISQNFTATVVTGGTADGGGLLTVTIYVGSAGINANSSDPNRNLNRPLTLNDAVQIMGNHKLNIAYQKRGILFAPIDQIQFDVAPNMKGQYRDPHSGMGFRVTKFPSPSTNTNVLYLDALAATGIAPELVCVMCTDA
jgi:hypothetical protein